MHKLRHFLPVSVLAIAAVIASAMLVRTSVDAQPGHADESSAISRGLSLGPDVTVRNLTGVRNWGAVGSVRGYSIGTDSCNIGSAPSNWCDDSPNCSNGSITLKPNQHPVIAQNLYRLANGRFEQIGMSWLKHGFFALNTPAGDDCLGNDGAGSPVQCTQPALGPSQLGIGCTDVYSSSLNGGQGGPQPLGRRSEVNAATGGYVFPPDASGSGGVLGKRIQVPESDLSVAGARFWAEGHYVVDDDAEIGNGFNNASYREVTVGSGFDLSFPTATVRETAAIFAWQAVDPAVDIVNVDIPGAIVERFHAARRVTDLGAGVWRYDFAIHNMNSDRSARSFTVDFPGATTITNDFFNDVDHHSGEPYSTADWTSAVNTNAGTISWSTDSFAADPDANALRWGTMFSFGFEATRPPTGAEFTLGLFKSPANVAVPFPGSASLLIFADGFDQGSTSAWSSTVP